MPDWYATIATARYARMSGPEFVRLPMFWQDAYEAARIAEIEAGQATVTEDAG